jgi:NitT/TauT family transport system substrate-binding protein
MLLNLKYLSRPMATLVGALLLAAPVSAEQIVVSNYGVSANGMPFAIAMAKGYFKDEGADVTGIVTSDGGGTTLRNMLAGDVPYGEVNPSVVIAAIQKGADIKIVSDNASTVAEFVWAVKPNSSIKTVQDLKGKKIAYTNPRSTSQALATLLLQSGGLKTEDAELVKTGGFGEGVAALDTDLVDIAPIPEPLWSKFKDQYRPIARATDILPPLENVVGVVSESQGKIKADFIRAVIRARRKAVDFMIKNPDEAGDIVAKAYNLDPAVARAAVSNLTTSRTAGMPYWGPGTIHMEGLKRMVDLQKSVGAITGDVDVTKMIDTSFLPDDIKDLK